jgi:hypothetical protein
MPRFLLRRLLAAPCVLLIALVVCGRLLPTPNAMAADYTWQGGGTSTAWSNGGNWLGGTAPAASEAIGTLTFPLLGGQDSANDLSGLSINHLQVDDSHDYVLSGQGFSLGSGGLSIGASEGTAGSFITSTPITLIGNQTWSVSQNIILGEALSGENSDLTINVNGGVQFYFGDPYPGSPFGPLNVNNELGNVTINGSAPGAGGSLGSVVYLTGGKFNADDGHMLTLHNVQLEGGAVTGPITATGSDLFLGGGLASGPVALTSSQLSVDETLSLPSLSLDGASTLKMYVGISGSNQSDEIMSTGAISLGGSMLEVITPGPGSSCLPPNVGQTYTLLSTMGSLSGTFGSYSVSGNPTNNPLLIPCFDGNHKTGPDEETAARVYLYRINYNTAGSPKTVTATVQSSVPVIFGETGELPTISGNATVGQTLSESHASWSNEPTSYSDQWQRCDSGGNNCQNIAGATGQTYTLAAADIGSTLRVRETASNSEGASTPEASAQTAVVQAVPAGGGSSGGGSTTSGSSPSGGSSTGSTPGSNTTATIGSTQIVASLDKQLIPLGKAATIPALLKSGGLTMSFTALEAGTVIIQWYELPPGAKLARKTKAKPVLVANGQASFAGAGTSKVKIRLTSAGRKLLKHLKGLKLAAEGGFRPEGEASVSVTKVFVLRD